MDDAVRAVADLDEPTTNFVRKHAEEERKAGADGRRPLRAARLEAAPAAGLLLIDARNWRDDEDQRGPRRSGGYAYGKDLNGVEAREAMESNLRRTEVAVKNVDNREYGSSTPTTTSSTTGAWIAVRALTGRSPSRFIGDSADPHARGRGASPRRSSPRARRASLTRSG